MPKFTSSLIGALALGSAVIANAGVVYNVSGPGIQHSNVAGATEVDFNSFTCGSYASCSGNGAIVSGSVSGLYATPAGDNTPYLTVPQNNGAGTFTLGLNGEYNYFGLYWGSVDTYNYISFLLDGNVVGSYSGANLSGLLADGNQASDRSNRYVNFFFTEGSQYDSVRLTSNGYAFETDNHAYAKVPEPESIALLALGLIGLVLARKKLLH